MTRRDWWLLVGLLLVAGFLPYVLLLGQLPWGPDAAKWVELGSLERNGWWSWAVSTKHFVGYRPVTALTFVLNHALTGYASVGYRAFDLALHLGTGALVWVVYRQLTGDRSAFVAVAVVLLFGHPATEEVVPYVARRSYLLATCFGLGALAILGRQVLRPGRGWLAAWGAGLCLALAVLSNEVAYVLLPLTPLWVLHLAAPPDRRAALWLVVPCWALCALAVVRRFTVLKVWGGGYQKRYFAHLSDQGRPGWLELQQWRPRKIMEACWAYTLDPHAVDGTPALFTGVGASILLALATVWLLWTCWVLPVLRYDERAGRARAFLGIWMLGATLVVVLSQTWFWRQAYMLLPPMGMLLAITLSDAWRRRGERSLPTWVGGGMAAVLFFTMVFRGPLLRGGMDQGVHSGRIDGTQLARQVHTLVEDLQGPGRVYLVLPIRGPAAHIVRIWGDRYGASRELTFRLLAHLGPGGDPETAEITVEEEGRKGASLTLGDGYIFGGTTQVQAFKPTRKTIWLDRMRRPKQDVYVVVIDHDDAFVRHVTPHGSPR
ncbi:MAG: hypothetical protein KTR31_35315 [Myxococcales bacterium]|nr:hypothetical protein [Myxococcales bacterium]